MLDLIEDGTLEILRNMPSERRIFTRVPFRQTIRWRNAFGESGSAKILNVGRSGLCLSLSLYFRPGPALMFTFEDVLYKGRPVEVPALTVWCRADADDRRSFTAGFSVVHGEPDTLPAISEVFYAALHGQPSGHLG